MERAKPIPLPPRPSWADFADDTPALPICDPTPSSVSPADDGQARCRAYVELRRTQIVDALPTMDALQRQNALLELGQLVQIEAAVSGHVVAPETTLQHKHNAMLANVAQSAIVNSLKLDENALKRQTASILPRLLAEWNAAKASRNAPLDVTGGSDARR
ncbi:hypothetical protein [Methylocapsa palsarum]|uniref:hypothetical protein n=1 Tax=Methylocapsa palsarum TaxID=1612308 RepID=UPI001113C150|nr:hypothetical protein [Methylocapsa palsarum]